MNSPLDNYHQLLARVDYLCRNIADRLGDSITCSPGCSSCCTSITLFPVEAAALAAALDRLPGDAASEIRRHVRRNTGSGRCPLLKEERCLLYEARPIICRTHGLPILFQEESGQRIDCCPRNRLPEGSLPGSAVIDLDRLNSVLVAVNALYRSVYSHTSPERLTIADAILDDN